MLPFNSIKVACACSVILCAVFSSSFTMAAPSEFNIDAFNNDEQEKNPIVNNINTITAQNAPDKITRNIRLDNNGNLLITAFSDIIQFDGSSFTPIEKGSGIDNFEAFDALQDSKGNIWIASTHKGVFRYNGKTHSHFTTIDGLGSNRAMSVYEDTSGMIWIATQGGVNLYTGQGESDAIPKLQIFTTKDGLTSNDVSTVFKDSQGRIWIGTRDELSIHLPSKDKDLKFTEFTDGKNQSFKNVWSIIEDQQGAIWLSDNRGIWRIKGDSITNVSSSTKNARLYEDTEGNIWFTHGVKSTSQWGLSYYDKKSLLEKSPKATLVHMNDGMFFGISEDKHGSIWVGTLNGVFRYNNTSIDYFNKSLVNK